MPIVADVAAALPFRPTAALVGVATQGGRFPPAWRQVLRDCIRQGIAIENGLHEFVTDDPELVELAATFGVTLTDLRRAAGRPRRSDRREPRGARQDRPHRRLGLRDREDDGVARARPRGPGPRASPPASSRRGRRASRSPAGASPSTRSSRTSSPAPPSDSSSRAASVGESSSSSRGRARSRTPPTPASRSASSTGRRRTRSCSATMAGTTEVDGYPGHPLLSLPELVELHERLSLTRRRAAVACIALNTRHLDDDAARAAIAAGGGRDGARRRRPGAVRRRPPARRAARAPRAVSTGYDRRALRGAERADGERESSVRRAVAAAVSVAALAIAGGAPAADIGANDDTGKYAADAGAVFFPQMAALGLKQSVMTTRFVPSDPTAIQDGEALDRAIPIAELAGLRVALAVYPYPPREMEDGTATPAGVRRLAHPRRRALPDREAVRRHERAQPAGVHAAAVRADGRERLGRAGGCLPRRRLRRAQGRRPGDPRHRSRPLAARATTDPRRRATSPRRRCGSSRRSAPGTARAAARCR